MKRLNVEEHYLLLIDKERPFGSNGTWTETWTWEVFIASSGEEYMGKAVCENRDVKIPWIDLKDDNISDEMIRICKNHMNKY
ncbi:hypothetical protein [Metabacillus fastidiosus]|uniref:hypothetical protein n=1 Tax=Metabacillus fastidiosus TaxID=1458 RepID=UPI0008258477|nr:hypothetical protein [Metabacillus fastidiosus]MED4462669.1 hypothetical protein [Metabacillus fastidiosus]